MPRLTDFTHAELQQYLNAVLPSDNSGKATCRFVFLAFTSPDAVGPAKITSNIDRQAVIKLLRAAADDMEQKARLQ